MRLVDVADGNVTFHYGLLANRDRDERLALCRRLLAIEALRARLMGTAPAVAAAERDVVATTAPVAFERVRPHCGSRRIECRDLLRPMVAAFERIVLRQRAVGRLPITIPCPHGP